MAKSIITNSLLELNKHFQSHLFVVMPPPVFPLGIFSSLYNDCLEARKEAWPCVKEEALYGISQNNYRSNLGYFTRQFLGSNSTIQLLKSITGYDIEPCFSASCFTYYEGEGAFLAKHKDREKECFLTLLLYFIVEDNANDKEGVALQLYKNDDIIPYFSITACENTAIVLKGDKIIHERRPLKKEQYVSLLSACFSLK